MLVWVSEGTANADNLFALTTSNPITVDTTALTFETKTNILHAATHIRGAADEIDGDLLDVDYTAVNYTATITAPATHAEHLTAHLSGIDLELVDVVQDEGSAACAILTQSGQPNVNDLLVVGADTYEFDGALGNINVAIGGSAAATLAALLTAAQTDPLVTEPLFWDSPSATTLRLRAADAVQGNIIGSSPSIVLDASGVTAANYDFNCGNVNMNTLAGKAAGKKASCSTVLVITTAMITATTARISFPFTPTSFQVTCTDATGAGLFPTTDTFAIDGDDIVITLGVDLANTDVVHIVAYE
jgi:hypothetical protein